MANTLDIAQILSLISAAYPNFKMTPQTPDAYLAFLGDLPSDLLKAAVMKCCAESGRAFAPSVGEIRGAVAGIQKQIVGAPSSYQAWQEVCRAFIDYGKDGNPPWTHPLIRQTVEALGWRNLCMSENQVADRSRFIQAFEQMETRAENDALMLPEVRGYIEQNRLPAPMETIKQLAEGMKK